MEEAVVAGPVVLHIDEEPDSPALRDGLAGWEGPMIAPLFESFTSNAPSERPNRPRFCRPGESATGGGVHGPVAYRWLRCRQGCCGKVGVRSADAGDGTRVPPSLCPALLCTVLHGHAAPDRVPITSVRLSVFISVHQWFQLSWLRHRRARVVVVPVFEVGACLQAIPGGGSPASRLLHPDRCVAAHARGGVGGNATHPDPPANLTR